MRVDCLYKDFTTGKQMTAMLVVEQVKTKIGNKTAYRARALCPQEGLIGDGGIGGKDTDRMRAVHKLVMNYGLLIAVQPLDPIKFFKY